MLQAGISAIPRYLCGNRCHLPDLYLFEFQDAFQMNTNIQINIISFHQNTDQMQCRQDMIDNLVFWQLAFCKSLHKKIVLSTVSKIQMRFFVHEILANFKLGFQHANKYLRAPISSISAGLRSAQISRQVSRSSNWFSFPCRPDQLCALTRTRLKLTRIQIETGEKTGLRSDLIRR